MRELENYLTLVNERYVQLLQDEELQLVANGPAGTDESSVVFTPIWRHWPRDEVRNGFEV